MSFNSLIKFALVRQKCKSQIMIFFVYWSWVSQTVANIIQKYFTKNISSYRSSLQYLNTKISIDFISVRWALMWVGDFFSSSVTNFFSLCPLIYKRLEIRKRASKKGAEIFFIFGFFHLFWEKKSKFSFHASLKGGYF